MTQSEHLAKFHDTVAILVKAYLNDTLVHGNCYACAVGNMVAAGLGCGFKEKSKFYGKHLVWDNGMPYPGLSKLGWGAAFCTDIDLDDDGCPTRIQKISERELDHAHVMEQIQSTGYSWQELAQVEYAFESANQGNSIDEWMFNGLMAVVDVLASIHGVDLETTEAARKLFVKA